MGIGTAQVLSAQEQAIVEGKKVLHGIVSDRVLRMFDAIRAYGPPRVALERAVYFTESFKTTEGQPLVLRWAKALKHIAENISVAIFDDELIVGRANTWLGRYSLVYPELDGTIMQAGAEAFIAAKGAPDAVTVTDEDKQIIDEVLFPYWNGKTLSASKNWKRSPPSAPGCRRIQPAPSGRQSRPSGLLSCSHGLRRWSADRSTPVAWISISIPPTNRISKQAG